MHERKGLGNATMKRRNFWNCSRITWSRCMSRYVCLEKNTDKQPSECSKRVLGMLIVIWAVELPGPFYIDSYLGFYDKDVSLLLFTTSPFHNYTTFFKIKNYLINLLFSLFSKHHFSPVLFHRTFRSNSTFPYVISALVSYN